MSSGYSNSNEAGKEFGADYSEDGDEGKAGMDK